MEDVSRLEVMRREAEERCRKLENEASVQRERTAEATARARQAQEEGERSALCLKRLFLFYMEDK